MHLQVVPSSMPQVPSTPQGALDHLLREGVTWGDSAEWLPRLPPKSVDLFFTSPPYADQRAYSRIHPDRYVEWFLPFARAMFDASADTGSLVINIKNRVAKDGPLRGQRHPYVFQLVIALQNMGWRWIEEYIWQKPNAIPGRFGPRTKDAFEHVFHFARGAKPHFDLDAVRVPYKTSADTSSSPRWPRLDPRQRHPRPRRPRYRRSRLHPRHPSGDAAISTFPHTSRT